MFLELFLVRACCIWQPTAVAWEIAQQDQVQYSTVQYSTSLAEDSDSWVRRMNEITVTNTAVRCIESNHLEWCQVL